MVVPFERMQVVVVYIERFCFHSQVLYECENKIVAPFLRTF